MNRNTQKTLLAGIALATSATAQTTTLNMGDSELEAQGAKFSQPIILGEGDKFELLVAGAPARGNLRVLRLSPGAELLGEDGRIFDWRGNADHLYEDAIEFGPNNYHQTYTNKVHYGPCKIQLRSSTMEGSHAHPVVTYRITRNAAGGGSSPAVKIPAGATGDVQVVMESSEDGTTWVLAGPGPYPANGNRRQFRLRVISQ